MYTQINKTSKSAADLHYRYLVLGCLVVMSGLYVLTITALSTSGSAIGALERRASELARNNRSLEAQIADAQSLDNLTKRMEGKNFVPVHDVAFAGNLGKTVAAR